MLASAEVVRLLAAVDAVEMRVTIYAADLRISEVGRSQLPISTHGDTVGTTTS
jgi:hypothetical protein